MLQIPSSRSQNKPSRILWVLRLHASRDKFLRRARGFVGSDFKIHVSGFKSPRQAGSRDVPDFPFLNSRFKTHHGRGEEITDLSCFQDSRFQLQLHARTLQIRQHSNSRFRIQDTLGLIAHGRLYELTVRRRADSLAGTYLRLSQSYAPR